MEYKEMLRFIQEQRRKINKAANGILQKHGGTPMKLDEPAADPKKLKKQGGLFAKQKSSFCLSGGNK
jgi:hypothetical protein